MSDLLRVLPSCSSSLRVLRAGRRRVQRDSESRRGTNPAVALTARRSRVTLARHSSLMTNSFCTAVVLALVMFMAPAGSRPRAQRNEQYRMAERKDIDAYERIVARYRAKDGKAIAELLTWEPAQIKRAIEYVNTIYDQTRPWKPIEIEAAALLHTDASLQLMHDLNDDAMELQLDFAGRILQKGGAPARGFASRWYVAVA